jgi:hypothetical protein
MKITPPTRAPDGLLSFGAVATRTTAPAVMLSAASPRKIIAIAAPRFARQL